MRKFAHVIAIIFLFYPFAVMADGFDRCGRFKVEGYLKRSGGQVELLLNAYSHSEVRVRIKKLLRGDRVSGPVSAVVLIRRACRYICESFVTEITGLIDPFEVPNNPFFPPLRPFDEIPCEH